VCSNGHCKLATPDYSAHQLAECTLPQIHPRRSTSTTENPACSDNARSGARMFAARAGSALCPDGLPAHALMFLPSSDQTSGLGVRLQTLQSSPCTLLPDPPYTSVVIRSTTTPLCLAHSYASGDILVQSFSARRFTRFSGAVRRPTTDTPVILGEDKSTTSSLRQCSITSSTCSSDSISYQILRNVSSLKLPARRALWNSDQLRSLKASALRSTSKHLNLSDAEFVMLCKSRGPARHLESRAIRRCCNGFSFGCKGRGTSTQHSVQSRSSSDAGNMGNCQNRDLEMSNDCKHPRDEKSNLKGSRCGIGFSHTPLSVRC
jgi:hypothetical protein